MASAGDGKLIAILGVGKVVNQIGVAVGDLLCRAAVDRLAPKIRHALKGIQVDDRAAIGRPVKSTVKQRFIKTGLTCDRQVKQADYVLVIRTLSKDSSKSEVAVPSG